MTKITRSPVEHTLILTVEQMLRVGVTTVSKLMSNAGLRTQLMEASYFWADAVGSRQHIVLDIAQAIGMEHDEVVGDFVNHMFGEGRKHDYPCLRELLDTAVTDGATSVAPYLMKAMANRSRDLKRRHATRLKHTGSIYGYTQDDEYDVIDPGEAMDTATATAEEDCLKHEKLMTLLTTMGQNFPSDLVILADAVGIKREVMKNFFFKGQQTALVALMTKNLSSMLHVDCAPYMGTMMQQAKTFHLSARLKQDPDALLAYLYRQSSGAHRRRLAGRLDIRGFSDD